MFIVIGSREGVLSAQRVDDSGALHGTAVPVDDLAAFVAANDGFPDSSVRWVWDDTARRYPPLLAAGIRIARCHDLRLCHAILRNSALVREPMPASDSGWDDVAPFEEVAVDRGTALFELGEPGDADGLTSSVEELQRQRAALDSADEPGRLRLLLAAESAGAAIAAEMRFAGLPRDTAVHDAALADILGPRVPPGVRPKRLEELAVTIRGILDDPQLNPDSPQDVLRSLRRAGLMVESTRAWELREVDHPVVEPLLDYKKRSRLLTANGWAWMDAWIRDGRFRAEYLPGGVVTGRWAARGGGALQLPKQIRSAVRADPGWTFVVADAAQLEPRVLAALAQDEAMAAAGRGMDMYSGFVAAGVVASRPEAKVAMLGAMYGATTGESARLLPRLTRAFPRGLALVETAARSGERGDVVTSRLGRSSPRPSEAWFAVQRRASGAEAGAADERRARGSARDQGRFTRNFVVQSSAAEWALSWMAELRISLARLPADREHPGALTGSAFEGRPHLVFFLHDEVIVHTPVAHAERVVELVSAAAVRAGRLLFGDFPVDFPLGIAVVDDYGRAK